MIILRRHTACSRSIQQYNTMDSATAFHSAQNDGANIDSAITLRFMQNDELRATDARNDEGGNNE